MDDKKTIEVGDEVVLINVPDWLIHDLPEADQKEITSYVGTTFRVEEIDQFGYFWLGAAIVSGVGEPQEYASHAFCVESESLVWTIPGGKLPVDYPA